ncbi:MAG: type II secretion system major pseudopilin GspG [Halobacteriovoraceae bacterium]|nr:type II secretion system major pseudopilin GspG [Halobacteriovoraceae bacterium]
MKFLRSNAGFSLLEILIALTLLGIAGAFVASKVLDNLQEGKVEAARIQIQRLGGILDEFKRHCNRYPTTEQGLSALLEKPTAVGGRECKRYRPGGYIKDGKLPLDPWDNEFIYESPDEGRTYTIISLGSDGLEGGDGFDADIVSSDL